MKILTATEASEELGISPQQIRTLIRQGKLPAEKHGRDWMIKFSDLALVRVRKLGRPKEKGTTAIKQVSKSGKSVKK